MTEERDDRAPEPGVHDQDGRGMRADDGAGEQLDDDRAAGQEQATVEDVVTRTEAVDGASEATGATDDVQTTAGGDARPDTPVIIDVQSITAGYVPEVDILNGCDLVLHKGEIVGIVGPNGAGKSTLLKAVFGLLDVREGDVTLNGQSIVGKAAHELVEMGIGFVPQTENVFPSLSIRENLQMGAYLAPDRFDARLEEVTEMFPRLGERLSQRAGALSGGERQMLAMSRALMMEPDVLLMDEPSAGLSPDLQDEVFINAKRINRSGVSIIMVEQNARRCLQICDRGYVLDQGRNAYTGGGRDLLDDPKVIELYLGTLGRAE